MSFPKKLARWVRNFGVALAAVAVALLSAAGLVTLGIYQAVKHQPAFYEKALAMEPERQKVAGDAMERSVLELHNDVRKPGDWQAVFSDEHINGWLASDLVEKFPDLLPDEVREPRISVEPEVARVACRYKSDQIDAVISLVLEIHLTDKPNQVAVRICKARAGALPLPLKNFLDKIARVAESQGLPLEWAQEEGDPVALFKIPAEHEDYETQGIYLEHLELRAGEVYLSGTSGKPPGAQVALTDGAKDKSQR